MKSQSFVQGPELQSFLKVKVILTLREVILGHENLRLLSIFRTSLRFNRFSAHQIGSQAFIFKIILVCQYINNFEISVPKVRVTLTLRNDCSPGPISDKLLIFLAAQVCIMQESFHVSVATKDSRLNILFNKTEKETDRITNIRHSSVFDTNYIL